jgi:hypothetical protein
VVSVLDTATRSWAPEPAAKRKARRRLRPAYLVVLDTETTLDLRQGLLVGAYRYVRVTWDDPRHPVLSTAEEGLILPDDADEDVWRLARRYASEHPAGVDPMAENASTVLALRTRADFCEHVLWEACWQNRAWLVGFNLAFDLSRLALSWTEGRGKGARRANRGAVVLRLWEHEGADNRFRPNVYVGHLQGRRHTFAWGGVEDPPRDAGKHTHADDHFLDLATLAFALTNRRYSLEGTCGSFGVPYAKRPVRLGTLTLDLVTYCREDVAATTTLAGAVLGRFYSHPVPLDADRAYSPAAIGTSYFERMALRPPRAGTSALPEEQLAQAQAAFYGQRMEARIRHVPVPVALVDFSSQYPVVAHLLGLWRLLTSERLAAVEATDDVRELLGHVALDEVLDPSTWPELAGFALVEPEGDWLPRRAYFAGSADLPRASLGPTWGRPGWWALPDLVAAKIATGKALKVLAAWRLVGEGRQSLRTVRLGGKIRFDPALDDWWLATVGARHDATAELAQGLKTVANATAYGCWERHDQGDRPAAVALMLPDGREREATVRPEVPHRWTFPPFAALVTAGGRLLMGALEALLAERGGSWASANTDSATVVASEAGGLVACPGGPERTADGAEAVRALTWAEVDELRQRFEKLNPLTGRDLLKLEPENFGPDGKRRQLHAIAVSGGRTLVFAHAGWRPVAVKHNEHNLGELRSPSGPGREFLDDFALWALGELSDDKPLPPPWWGWPATSSITASTASRLRQLGSVGTPFGFVMAARGRPAGAVLGAWRRVVAPLCPPELAASAPWRDAKSGEAVRVPDAAELARREELVLRGAEGLGSPDEVVLETYGAKLRAWLRHPELKMAGPDSKPCGFRTRGLLAPRPVVEGVRHYVGRESNLLDEVEAGEVIDPGEVLADFGDDSWECLVAPVLRAMGFQEAERRSGVRRERVAEFVKASAPRSDALGRLVVGASAWAAEQLDAWGLTTAPRRPAQPPESRLAVLGAYLAAAPQHARACACADGPGHAPARPGSPYCSERCRQRAKKQRQRTKAKAPEAATTERKPG